MAINLRIERIEYLQAGVDCHDELVSEVLQVNLVTAFLGLELLAKQTTQTTQKHKQNKQRKQHKNTETQKHKQHRNTNEDKNTNKDNIVLEINVSLLLMLLLLFVFRHFVFWDLSIF